MKNTKSNLGWITAVVCFAVFFVGNYAQYQISPIAAAVMAELGISMPQFSLLFTACMYPALALSLVAGVLCDKFGAKLCVSLALAFSAAGISGRIFADNYSMMLVCMVLSGLGCMFLTATSAKILAPYFGSKVGKVMGPVSAGNTLGMFLAMATTALFATTKVAYTVSAALSIAVLIAWIIFAKDPAPAENAPGSISVTDSIRICLKNKYVWLCGMTLLLLMVGQIMVASSLPIALQTNKGMSPSTTGTISSIYMIGAVLGAAFGPQVFFGLKKGKRVFITICTLITAVGVSFTWHIPNSVLLSAALLVCGFALSTFIPMILSLPVSLPGVGPAYAGTAGGMIATIQIIGCTIVPSNILTPAFTNAAGVTNFNMLFAVAGIIVAFAAVTVNLLPIYTRN